MSELTVLLHPDPRLKKTCIPVTNIDKSIKKLCLDMIETMYKYSGVGFITGGNIKKSCCYGLF